MHILGRRTLTIVTKQWALGHHFCISVLDPLAILSKYILNIFAYVTDHCFLHRYWNYLGMHSSIVVLRCFMLLWFAYLLDDFSIFGILACIHRFQPWDEITAHQFRLGTGIFF